MAGLNADQRDAYAMLTGLLGQYGLGSLSSQVLGFVKAGYSGQTVGVLIQDTPEYKQRFSANAIRVKSGLAPLTPAEYLSTESAYRQVARSHGLPAGFLNTDKLLGMDVSPTEMNERADMAGRFMAGVDPAFSAAFSQMFGAGGGGSMLAAIMDPERAIQVLKTQMKQAEIGMAASKAGHQIGAGTAQDLLDRGLTGASVIAGYQKADNLVADVSPLAGIYGESYGQTDAENEALRGDVAASRKRAKLIGLENAQFGGGGNASGAFKTAGNQS